MFILRHYSHITDRKSLLQGRGAGTSGAGVGGIQEEERGDQSNFLVSGSIGWGPSGTKAIGNVLALEIVAEIAMKTIQLNSIVGPIAPRVAGQAFPTQARPRSILRSTLSQHQSRRSGLDFSCCPSWTQW